MLQQAALTQKWFIGVFDDGTLGRAMSVMPASVDPAFYNDGYNPEADYAVNNTPEAVAERRRKRRLALA